MPKAELAMLSSTRSKWIQGLMVLALCVSVAVVHGAGIEPVLRTGDAESSARTLGHTFDTGAVCESPRCSALDGNESCTACRVWDYALTGLNADQVSFETRIVENGVVMRATSDEAQVQQLLWTVSVARHHILELVRQGGRVPLCGPCHRNVQAFAEVEVGTSRLPDGVLLMYTSSSSEIVAALHAMVLSGQDLPL